MSLTYNKIGMVRVKEAEKVPQKNHYAILIFTTKSVWVPGDERSKTHPGHGYPEHTDYYETFEYWVADTLDKLKAGIALLEKEKDPPKYKAIRIVPLEISTKIKIDIKVDGI